MGYLIELEYFKPVPLMCNIDDGALWSNHNADLRLNLRRGWTRLSLLLYTS